MASQRPGWANIQQYNYAILGKTGKEGEGAIIVSV
jgi:hypothetical protein